MIDRAALISDLQRILKSLEADLRIRATDSPKIDARFRAARTAALADKRTAAPFLEWGEDLIGEGPTRWAQRREPCAPIFAANET